MAYPPGPFEEVWPEVEELFEQDAGLQAKTVFDEIVRRYPPQDRSAQDDAPPNTTKGSSLMLGDDRTDVSETRTHPQ